MNSIKGKKVLLVGLGLLGGGEEIAKFLIKKGAKLTITDLRCKEILEPSIERLPSSSVDFIFGKHRKVDFKNNDIIVFNQAVPVSSPWVKLAKQYKKLIKSDIVFFLECLQNKKLPVEYIAITGTRGKTTISTWIDHFLDESVLGGNIPSKSMIKILNKKTNLFVLELSSFQLEYMTKGLLSPKIAIISNLYNDHLNRYGTLKKYLKEKSKIFLNQTKNDFLILNFDDKCTVDFLKMRPKAQLYFVSLKKLPKNKNGLFFAGSEIYFQENGQKDLIHSISGLEEFQKMNLLASLLGAYLHKRSWKKLIKSIADLPQVSFRQEIVFKNRHLKIINDGMATSPDATISAVKRFGKEKGELVLITGGTDKKLDFAELSVVIKKYIKPQNLFLLEGSATVKIINELKKLGYFKKTLVKVFASLNDILFAVNEKKDDYAVILFSPASASFEKFNNEVDRGNTFNKLIKKF